MNIEELLEQLEKAKINEPVLPFELGYNLAIQHAMEHIKLFERQSYPLGRNDYQE